MLDILHDFKHKSLPEANAKKYAKRELIGMQSCQIYYAFDSHIM